MSISLRTKVFLPLLILMALLISYLYLYWMPRSLANMERQCQESTERHLDSVVEGVIPLLLGRELDMVYENFDALLKKNSDWIGLRLTDAAGRQLYPLENIPAPAPAKKVQNLRELTMSITYLDMNLGTLTVIVDLAPHLAELKQDFNNAVSVMLFVIAVIVLSVGIVLERKVVQPVKALGHAAQELAQGKFDELQLKAGDDEVGHLVDSFNSMRAKLASSYDLLRQSEQKNRAITITANDAIIMMDDKGYVLIWNPAAEGIFGFKAGEVLGRYLHDIIMPERYRADFEKGFRCFSETGRGPAVGKTVEMTARRKDNVEFPVELSLSALQINEQWHAVGIVRDITRRKQAESRLLDSLKEKEILLQEIHHRVKNNMQVIASLLDLQLGYVGDRQPQEIFSDIKNRIKSMALVHEKLYRSNDLSKIDFRDYLGTLIDNLYRFYNISTDRVVLHLDVGDIAIGIDTAIPCGLIVNELVTNSLKYAFPGDRTGDVSVSLREIAEEGEGGRRYELTVKDNGVGIPETFVLKDMKTLGLYLVTTLVEHQLQGSIELNRMSGTDFSIRFRELKYKKRI
ncbi:MAG: PAS domain S-box protein [Nitrospirae bacterium]|nr:PAS domain S-box protein [Nitrospirota bacterium]